MKTHKAIRGYDFHCHVDLFSNPQELIATCERNQIVTVAVTTTPRAWPQNHRWAYESNYVMPALGLHPELAGSHHQEVVLVDKYIKDCRLVGEIGLDGSIQHRKNWNLQVSVFRKVLCAAQRVGRCILSIHSRKAESEVLECLESDTSPDRVLPILHWFSGTKSIGMKAVDIGCYFSYNKQALETSSGLSLFKCLPEDRLLTETDGPFTYTGLKKSRPYDVLQTTEYMASVRDVSKSHMKQIVCSNATRVFSFANIQLESVVSNYKN